MAVCPYPQKPLDMPGQFLGMPMFSGHSWTIPGDSSKLSGRSGETSRGSPEHSGEARELLRGFLRALWTVRGNLPGIPRTFLGGPGTCPGSPEVLRMLNFFKNVHLLRTSPGNFFLSKKNIEISTPHLRGGWGAKDYLLSTWTNLPV